MQPSGNYCRQKVIDLSKKMMFKKLATLKLPHSIVSNHWLATHLKNPNLLVFDSSLKSPVNKTTGVPSNSKQLQIPGARVFNLDNISDHNTTLPHMMPSEELFTQKMRELGVCKNSVIVFYDNRGIYSSPRAWWMLKAMGHEQVAVLNGGLPGWIKANLPCEESMSNQHILAGDFVAKQSTTHFCNVKQIESALEDKACVVLDARPEKRFLGQDPEPRSGLRLGHMPNAHNIPFDAVLENGQHMKPTGVLQDIFATKASHQQQLFFSCGSGVTACILALAADLAGYSKTTVYDGSWSEWGLESSSRPVVTASPCHSPTR
jgi:thiosulfate/3-mercaptopyruvate sulfurtransferase